MNAMTSRWADLVPRMLSAAAMIAVIVAVEYWGGLWSFGLLVGCVTGAMVWEFVRMAKPGQPIGLAEGMGLSGGLAVFVFSVHSGGLLALLLIGAAVALIVARIGRVPGGTYPAAVTAGYLALILYAGHALVILHEGAGLGWMIWLVGVVVASDVAGYFAGKALGGPKFWPRVSPKKTWSGTVAGWVAAAAVGWGAMGPLGAGWGLVLLSVLTAMAGQAGDIAESALKRKAGVKDSSRLIPGHGGVMDRFDAMIAAALFVLAAALVAGLPPLAEGM